MNCFYIGRIDFFPILYYLLDSLHDYFTGFIYIYIDPYNGVFEMLSLLEIKLVYLGQYLVWIGCKLLLLLMLKQTVSDN